MSFVAWLDHSTEDERRVREMIRLFDQPETQDVSFKHIDGSIDTAEISVCI